MNSIRLLFIFTSLLGLTISGCSDGNLAELKDSVHLRKSVDESYELIFDEGTEDEWVYKDVDSLSISEGYNFLFFGKSNHGSEKKWFYVSGAPLEFKKAFGNWGDTEFRKHRLKELMNGQQLYQNLKTTSQVWKENN